MELFELYLSPNNHSTQFRVLVTQSPASEGEAESSLPFFEGEKDWRTTLIKTLESTRFSPEDFPYPGESDWMVKAGILTPEGRAFHPNRLKNIGQALYGALVPAGSQVEQALQSAIRAAEHKNTQLHIQLRFKADSVQRSRLADYPWELMHDGQRFLAHHLATFSRYIAHDTVPPNLPSVEQVNVLLVSSAAFARDQGLNPLSTQEQLAIYQGLKNAQQNEGHIRLFKLKQATRNQLRAYLTEHQGTAAPHVLHFDGHGLYGKRCQNEQCRTIHKGIKVERCRVCNTALPEAQGYLVFEDEEGQPDYVSAAELGVMLQQSSFRDSHNPSTGVFLTVLSACQSGMAVAGDSVFNGTAQNLIGHRVPAVVAMQYSVSVPSATQFAEQFYRSLGQKNSLAVAVSQGREAMGAEGHQWYRPVLYLRWQDNEGGQLFSASQTISGEVREKSPPTVPVVAQPVPLPDAEVVKPIETGRQPPLALSRWRKMLMVSLTVTGVLVGLRFFGGLEGWELKAFDHLMQLRLEEGIDQRLLIVTITDQDILDQDKRGEKGYGNSLRDPSLNRLLAVLELHKPRLIGLDLYRSFSADPSVPGLAERLKHNPIVGVCKVPTTDDQGNPNLQTGVPPPKEVPLERVGFSDFILDPDETLRRHLMAQEQIPGAECRTQLSFSLVLARRYLELEPGNSDYQDPFATGENLQLKGVLFPQLQPFTGGYQDVDNSGFQVLLNYRATPSGKIAKELTLQQVLNQEFNPEDVRNKIVLVGSYANQEGPRDQWLTPYGTLHGVAIHAHMVSQMLSAVLEGRPLLRVWSQGVEMLWIWGWSLVGGVLACYWSSPKHLGIAGSCGLLGLYLICLTSLIAADLWLPLIPPALALVCTGAGVVFVSSVPRQQVPHLGKKL